jgi:Predicted nucleotide kinase
MNILITGKIGAGKTIVCKKIAERLKSKGHEVFGFLTFPIIESGRRVGFYIVGVKSGERTVLAKEYEEGMEGQRLKNYIFSLDGIEFGIRALNDGGDVCFVDEIGLLELRGKGFFKAIQKPANCKDLIVTARTKFAAEVKKLFAIDFKMVEVTASNRDSLPQTILQCLSIWGK